MNWMKYKFVYFAISLVLIIVSVISLIAWGLPIGVDFKGGTFIEYRLTDTNENLVKEKLGSIGYENVGINVNNNIYSLRFSPLDNDDRKKVLEVVTDLSSTLPEELRYENVGPSIAPELVKKTYYAVAIAATAILLWVAYQFKSIKFGASAVIAMFHDSFILVGMYSLLGKYYSAEVDFLFVTAVLTILSFSVHDTIVVYDRIRELKKKESGDITSLANRALTETMVRSFNNSMTIVFMLVALILLGGETVKWFASALLIGTVLGTYSSPFVAVPILVVWDKIGIRIKN